MSRAQLCSGRHAAQQQMNVRAVQQALHLLGAALPDEPGGSGGMRMATAWMPAGRLRSCWCGGASATKGSDEDSDGEHGADATVRMLGGADQRAVTHPDCIFSAADTTAAVRY